MSNLDPFHERNSLLIRFGRLLLWLVIVSASVKPIDVFGVGEQGWGDPPAIDVIVRFLVLAACALSCAIAFFTGKIRRESLSFLPFLAWTVFVALALQSDLSTAKQLGSYATWILFYVAANSLLHRETDFKTLAYALVFAVVLSALGGELQCLLGYGPQLGTQWPNGAGTETEFHRTHTGGGGILLDTFTPYCAAILLIATAGKSMLKHAGAWLLVLWGTANILRGGMLAFTLGFCWYLWVTPKEVRKRILPFLACGLVGAVVLFGSTISAKTVGKDDQVSTSGRLSEWPQLMGWIESSPILGHGPDADLLLIASSSGKDLRASHNELLSTGVNFGMVGIAFLWLPLLFLLMRSMAEAAQAPLNIRSEAGAASTIVLMIVVLSFTDNTLRTPGVMMLALAPIAICRIGHPSQVTVTAEEFGSAQEPC